MIWQDRTRTDPTKRKFIDENGNEQNVNIEEIQSNITQSGTPVNATTMNNIEKNLGTYGNDTYDSTATYLEGETVTHNALLYRALQDIDTPEEWTAAHWEETSVLDELANTSGNEVLVSDDEQDITRQTKLFINSDTGTAKYRDTNDSFVPLKDNEVVISDTEPISNDNEIWIDTSSNATYMNQEVNIGATNVSNIPVWFKKGKNLFSSSLESGTYSDAGIKSSSSTNYRNVTPIQVQPNTIYTFSINGVSQKYAVYYYNNTNTFISSEGLTTGTFTTPANCYYINFRCFNADFTSDYASLKLQIEEGSIATAYEPYISPSIIADDTEFYSKNNYEQYLLGETRIGTFLGKPLYRTTFISNTYSTSFNVQTPNINEIINLSAKIQRSDYTNIWQTIPSRLSSTGLLVDFGNITLGSNVTSIAFNFGTDWANQFNKIVIVIEYTKTTD